MLKSFLVLELPVFYYPAMHYNAYRGIAILILSVCYIREPWLNRLISPKIMSQLISPWPGSLHYTARRSNSRRTSPDFGWKARGMCVSGICDTKPAMSLKQSSLKPNLLQSVYRNSCTVCWLVPNLGWTLAYFSREQNFSARDVSHFLLEHNEICHIRGLVSWNLFPKFCELVRWSCDTMRKHASVLHWCTRFTLIYCIMSPVAVSNNLCSSFVGFRSC